MRVEVWKYAAEQAERQGDMRAARGFWIRGSRFCPSVADVYLGWAGMELRWLARVKARRRVLGLDASTKDREAQSGASDEAKSGEMQEHDADVISLPTVTAGEFDGEATSKATTSETTIAQLDSAPIMKGAIPKVIFDTAVSQCSKSNELAAKFFDLSAEFHQISGSSGILQHVLHYLINTHPYSIQAGSCRCRLHLVGVPLDSRKFPEALRTCLKDVQATFKQATIDKPRLGGELRSWLEPLSNDKRLVPELKKVIQLTLARFSAK